ncbi:MAG: peptidoglycan binding domain-containing protein, partial [Propionibacteriaceae bacterium]|nr:peptidoglycan binding domain-containing protein [Propionibacteriaceae bacterium]
MSPQTPRQFASGTPGEEPPTNQLPAMTGEVLAAAQARAEAKLAESNVETGMSAYPPIEFARPAATPPSPPGGQPAKRPPKKHHPLRVVVIVALVLALSGVGTLFGTSKYFAGKAKIGTSIAGTAVTGKTEAQMLDMVNQTGGNTTLTLDLNGKQAPYDLQALGITVDAQQTVDNALGKNDPANKSWWPVRRVDVPIVFNYSENQLQQALDADFVDGSLTPKNAAVSYDGTSSKFTVTSDQPGATVDVSPVLAAIDTLSKGGTVGVISLTTQTVPAPITSDAATQAANSANSTIGQEYTFATPKKSVTLDSKQVASWLTLTPDALAGTIAVGVDQDAVSQQ